VVWLIVDPDIAVTTCNASVKNAGVVTCIVTTLDEADRLCLATLSALRSWAVTDCTLTVLGGRQSLAAAMRLRRDLCGYDAARGIGRLSAIRSALDSLRGRSSRETMKAATALLCRDFGFTRVMVSTVREHDWLPRYVYGSWRRGIRFLPRVLRRGSGAAGGFGGRGRPDPWAARRRRVPSDSIGPAGLSRGADHRRRRGERHAACDFPEAPGTTVMDQFDLLEAFVECLAMNSS